MADYVFLYTGGSMPESEEEQAKAMKAWEDWFADVGAALKDGGNPFGPAAKTLASDGAVRDGVSGTVHTGYSIVTTDSLDAAVALAKGCPILHGGGGIAVYETLSVM
jgi:hypothetical protein